MAEIYYGEYVLIPFPADLKDRPTVTLRHDTTIDETPTGREKRKSKRAVLRRIMNWTLTAKDGELAGRIEETLRIAQEAKKACVPRFLSARRIASIAGATITLDAQSDVYLPAGSVAWWSSQDSTAYGLAIVLASTTSSITIAAVPAGMAAGAYIGPVALGFISGSPTVKEIHGGARRFVLEFSQSMGEIEGSFRTESESPALGVSISGSLVEVSPNRTASDSVGTLGVSLSGTFVTVVVTSTASDSVGTLGVSLSGTFVTVVVNTNQSDTTSLGVTLSGSLG